MRLLRQPRSDQSTASNRPVQAAGRPATPRVWLLLGGCRQAGVGIVYGLALSGACLWSLQVFWPEGGYFSQVQVPLAQRASLPLRVAVAWVRQADAIAERQPDQALAGYGRALGILDGLNNRQSLVLQRQIQQQSEQIQRAELQPSALPRESWGEVLSRLRPPFAHNSANEPPAQVWLDALLFYPLVQEPQIWVLAACSLWLAQRFARSVREQLAWTRILDQSTAPGPWGFSPVRSLPELLGTGLGFGLFVGLVFLSPSVPVLLAVVLGSAVPVGLVSGLNAYYSRRSQLALDAWEVRYRAQFSSELHNTAQQSLMGASSVLREVLTGLETSSRAEDARLAWRLAAAADHCRAAEDELRLLRNGTEDMFARGQRFGAALDPIRDRLEREGTAYTIRWWLNGQTVPESQWEQQAFTFDTVADRRIAATLYQVVSELTWNALKYARRPQHEDQSPLRLDLCFHCLQPPAAGAFSPVRDRRLPSGFRLSVSDNGPGFDLREAYLRRPGSGLFALGRYLRRLEAVGARVRYRIDARPGQGSRFTIDILTGTLMGGAHSTSWSAEPPSKPVPPKKIKRSRAPIPFVTWLVGGMACAGLLGGLTASLLSRTGSLEANRTATPVPTPELSGATDPETGKLILQPEGVATARTLLAQVGDQQVLERAEIEGRTGQLGDLVKAIQKASEVSPRSLVYRNAQARIQQWSTRILSSAERQAKQVAPDAPQAQELLSRAIAIANLVPDVAPDYARAQARIQDWQKQQSEIRRQRELETLARVQAIQAQANQFSSPEAKPTLSILPLDSRVTEGDIDLQAEQVSIQNDGSFQLSLLLTNRASERFIFLVSQVALLDGQGQDITGQVNLEGAADGFLEPGQSVRLQIHSLSARGWTPPYQVNLPEVQALDARVLRLDLP
ncbi:sensor histidine kinase [Leptolyngbya sp. FACHB-261]|uniref:sensor histidine kinase n=1 Tax=Leptolyngbya sp. FACHB-261 TaxID=2692806 RepID=UPI0016867BBA|nr:sensor histidine kinase [Leptolyngbya sp. FACHB-261]MBD2104781.1 sensor histidine kinase [Leptolyngbya sp. FACHB-261]